MTPQRRLFRCVVATVRTVSLVAALSGCSAQGSASDAGTTVGDPKCPIKGFYLVRVAKVVSGNCPSQDGQLVADTFLYDGKVATMTAQGLTGTCSGPVDQCTWTTACEIILKDAIHPGDRATAQYNYKFTAIDFSGTVAVSIPPLVSLPNGCDEVDSVTGTKQ